jgi:hypothetical protein
MDILTDVLDRVRLQGTVLFRYEFGRPWTVALPRSADAIFHYLSKGSASIALEDGAMLQMAEGRSRCGHAPAPAAIARTFRWSETCGAGRREP